MSETNIKRPPLPTTEKLREARYNFRKLVFIRKPFEDEFRYEMNAFLTSATGALDILLGEYAMKYRLNLRRVKYWIFREQAIKNKNTEALQFLDWYDAAYKSLKGDKHIGFLVEKRNLGVHTSHNIMLPIWIASGGSIRQSINEDGQIEYHQDTPYFLQESWDAAAGDLTMMKDVREVCELFILAIEWIVSEAHSRFPLDS